MSRALVWNRHLMPFNLVAVPPPWPSSSAPLPVHLAQDSSLMYIIINSTPQCDENIIIGLNARQTSRTAPHRARPQRRSNEGAGARLFNITHFLKCKPSSRRRRRSISARRQPHATTATGSACKTRPGPTRPGPPPHAAPSSPAVRSSSSSGELAGASSKLHEIKRPHDDSASASAGLQAGWKYARALSPSTRPRRRWKVTRAPTKRWSGRSNGARNHSTLLLLNSSLALYLPFRSA